MNTKSIIASLAAAALPFVLGSCQDDDHDHDHGEHDHGEHAHEDHDHDHGHEHATNVKPAGPNGGRILFEVEPHVEFLVTEDRKVKITRLDEDNRPAGALPEGEITVTGGDRSDPVRLAFTADGTTLVSDGSLPEGNLYPVVVQFKQGDARPVLSKFSMNYEQCPTCDYLEYACTCGHADDGKGHSHDHGEKK